jgi:tetratricopeptide (TPR) repeat protein
MRLLAPLGLFLVLASTASAVTPRQLYVAGRYTEAESAAVAQGDAEGYALAARAALAAEMMRPEPCLSCLVNAQDLAQRAIDADPKLAEGQIEFVVALGYRARLMGVLAAHFKGLARIARLHIDAALADDPGNAWAWAALGGWNIEIAHGAGSALACWLYGASLQAGLDDFAKAFAAAPNNLVVRYQYALSLAAYDRNGYRSLIVDALNRACTDEPQGAYEKFAQRNAKELLDALNSGDLQKFDRLVRHDQGYP